MEPKTVVLPETVGKWVRSDSQKAITTDTIFEYMDGAGELYVGYRFNHLDVFEYSQENQDSIQVELYYMESSDDAFGLLSLDWKGECLSLSPESGSSADGFFSKSPMALYGTGLLRIWTDNIYARILTYRETPEAKQAIIDLGKCIVQDRNNSMPPDMVRNIPVKIGDQWLLDINRLHYFRSFTVLNTIYYISHENLLELDHSATVISASYKNMTVAKDMKPCQFILIRYQTPERAAKALNRFHDGYLSEFSKNPEIPIATFELEEGWFGYRMFGRFLAIVSGCPDEVSARMILKNDWT